MAAAKDQSIKVSDFIEKKSWLGHVLTLGGVLPEEDEKRLRESYRAGVDYQDCLLVAEVPKKLCNSPSSDPKNSGQSILICSPSP